MNAEYHKQYRRANRDKLADMARLRYYEDMRYTHEGYTHDCGAHFDSAAECYVHLLSKCESIIYRIFAQ